MTVLNAEEIADQEAMRTEVGAVAVERDVVRVHGPDTLTFLQGQLSQDVEAMEDGAPAWSFVLHPDGKVAAWVRVTRVFADDVMLDVDGGYGPEVVARLERFKLRIDCTIEPLDWTCVAVRGPAANGVDTDQARLTASADWPGAEGFDLLGPDVAIPDGVRRAGRAALEALRVEAGVPAMGSELTERTIPAESGVVERSVSFTKGCFTGQELVARIDSRGGNVPRRLRGIVVEGEAVPPAGAEIVVEGAVVGALTSTAMSVALDAPVALAYVRRSVEPPSAGEAVWDGGSASVRIEELPLV